MRRGAPGRAVLAALAAVVAALAYLGWLAAAVPDVGRLRAAAPASTAYMRLREAERGLPPGSYAVRWTPLDSMSPLLVCAVVKAEDRGFFRHRGFEWSQLRKAARERLQGRARMGGSTITQQAARNLYLGPRRSLHRKLREALIARRMERDLAKREVLELYLNVIEWGQGVWGAEAASRHYFGRPAAGLDAFEATFLAGLVAAPNAPLRGANRARARRVQGRVLGQLHRSGYVSLPEARAAVLRASAVYAALDAGIPLREALVRSAAPGAPRRPLPAVGRVLADGCGLARELAAVSGTGPASPAGAPDPAARP